MEFLIVLDVFLLLAGVLATTYIPAMTTALLRRGTLPAANGCRNRDESPLCAGFRHTGGLHQQLKRKALACRVK